MIRSKKQLVVVASVCLWLASCNTLGIGADHRFDKLNKSVAIGHWKYDLHVENQSENAVTNAGAVTQHYLKATLSLGNSKTQKSLLYSASKDAKDYEAKYKYLSFSSGSDLCIKCKDVVINPIGYVFEPSNGLSPSERLVYKFMLSDNQYKALKQNDERVEYWYTDHLIGLGKICFNSNN